MKPDFEFDVVSSELPVAIVAVAFAANAFAKPAVIVAASVAVTAAAIVAVTAAAIALVLMDPAHRHKSRRGKLTKSMHLHVKVNPSNS